MRAYAFPVLVVFSILTTACASDPAVHYKQLSPKKAGQQSAHTKVGPGRVEEPGSTIAADPADGEFTFALSVSSIMFAMQPSPASAGNGAASPAPSAVRPKPVGGGNGVTKRTVTTAGQRDESQVAASAREERTHQVVRPLGVTGDLNDADQTKDCEAADPQHRRDMDAWPWGNCWNTLQPNVAPHPDLDYVFAGRPSTGLKLDVTLAADSLTVKSLGSNWSSPSTAAVTRVGGEAVAGWTLAGPYGALVVVLGGEATHAADISGNQTVAYTKTPPSGPALPKAPFETLKANGYICDGEPPDHYPTDLDAKAQLLLPVALDLDRSLPDDKAHAKPGCWHRFPKGDVGYSNSGWLYRLIEDPDSRKAQLSVPPVYRDGLSLQELKELGIASGGDQWALPPDDKLAYFPTSACHAMKLEITWWSSAVFGMNDPKLKETHDPTHTLVYHVVIADPHFIQKMRLTKGSRTITVGACGATATGIAQSTPPADNFAEVMKQVQAVRVAQQNWDKAQAKK